MNGASYEWSMRVRDFDLANRARDAASAADVPSVAGSVIADTIGDQFHPRDASGRFTHTSTGREG